ncbi:MAG: 6,7-dimethyl-8-ribityllumazine synthase [Candidatus Parabeggiatoa sp. nov. 3]|nr:MAG: 6,7-dimethyl-8-ribityllumazine synthase [Gammaproteobacteria bacterium]RKZ60145.1 MAG: 6,7-dimethyl-8-ribityllumazine synthase [Gammaproteobacteria bacterium]RKZ81515.1 MAG: 6,7-dimethyl-8-ribityllumazine synthase [Gammaproteobacteria bacterium]
MKNNIAIVLGSFHRSKVEQMLEQARVTAKECELNIVAEQWVHGSMEKPLALKRLLKQEEVDGALALGIIESGETKHGLVMGYAVINAMIQLQMELMKPIGVGILGPEILPSQIPSRLKPYAKEAVIALKEML